jgi:hypothetical protein
MKVHDNKVMSRDGLVDGSGFRVILSYRESCVGKICDSDRSLLIRGCHGGDFEASPAADEGAAAVTVQSQRNSDTRRQTSTKNCGGLDMDRLWCRGHVVVVRLRFSAMEC